MLSGVAGFGRGLGARVAPAVAIVLGLAVLSLATQGRADTTTACVQLGSDCDAAIAAEADPKAKAVLLFRRGYLQNGVQHYKEALPDLEAALAQDPSNPAVLHEEAYALSSLMRYAEAIKALDAEARLRPNAPQVYQERAFSRHHSGDLAGALADWDKVVSLMPNDTGMLQARARAAMWLGRFDQASADLNAAEALAQAAHDDQTVRTVEVGKTTLALWSTPSVGGEAGKTCIKADLTAAYTRPNLIGDCTLAFLREPSPAAKAAALTVRSIVWTGHQDAVSATADQEMAVALDPANADWLSNLGFTYLNARHSWAALQKFDRSIAIKPGFVAYAGRAGARYNLGDEAGAFADAKASFEIRPNPIALMVLGDLAFEKRHDPKSARLYWMGAYRLGERDDSLTARLKQIGVTDPDKEPLTDAPPHPAGQ